MLHHTSLSHPDFAISARLRRSLAVIQEPNDAVDSQIESLADFGKVPHGLQR